MNSKSIIALCLVLPSLAGASANPGTGVVVASLAVTGANSTALANAQDATGHRTSAQNSGGEAMAQRASVSDGPSLNNLSAGLSGPDPSTLALLLSGLGVLVFTGKRRKMD